jgi:hypothetical protein
MNGEDISLLVEYPRRMRTLGLNHALLTFGLLLVACPGGGTDDDVGGDTSTDAGDGDGDTMTSETGDSDGETTNGETTDGESTEGETTEGETTEGETTEGETTEGETTEGETTEGETTEGETTGDGDGDCSGEGVGICNSEPLSDGFTIEMMAIVGDCLELDVSYSGGCESHTFTSCWDQSFAESDPVQAWLWVDHDAKNDLCQAIVPDTWTIDLSALKQAWQIAYQSQTGTIILHVGGESINYDF